MGVKAASTIASTIDIINCFLYGRAKANTRFNACISKEDLELAWDKNVSI